MALLFPTAYGGFSEDGREYIITTPLTPGLINALTLW